MTDAFDSEERETLLEFPCEFPLKMMGHDRQAFHEAARDIVERHAGALDDAAIRQSLSRKANFVALTITINAVSQEQLDRIYEELSAHDEILVAL
jgi:putative lipoic acid-binding regulatory protein